MSEAAIVGCILGTAVGDALGLPYEGISKRRGVRLLGEPTRHRFCFGRGMVSDDTEHTCMVAQALIASAGNREAFTRELAGRMRWWLAGLPVGAGRATVRAVAKLWLGYPPERSGVFSAGNGPAMRSAILGAAIDDLPTLEALVRASTRITHTDPKAEYGALAVALAARFARRHSEWNGQAFVAELRNLLPPDGAELRALVERATASVARGESTMEFADAQGWRFGVGAYVYQTVPVALHAWLRHPRDFRAAVVDAIRCGGDTDTAAAIAGGIIGAAVGKDGIPTEWLAGLLEWPRTVGWMERLGKALHETIVKGRPCPVPRLPALPLFGRDLLFFLVVFAHILRRLLPPY